VTKYGGERAVVVGRWVGKKRERERDRESVFVWRVEDNVF
jgi:hypothetical protein